MSRSLFHKKKSKEEKALPKEAQDALYMEIDRNLEQLHQLLDHPSDLTVKRRSHLIIEKIGR